MTIKQYSNKKFDLSKQSVIFAEKYKVMALQIASVPVLSGEAADRFDERMAESEKKRGSVDFSKQIQMARRIVEKIKRL